MRWVVRLLGGSRPAGGRTIAVASAVLVVAGCAAPARLTTTIEQAVEAGPGRNLPAYRQPTPSRATSWPEQCSLS